MTRRGMLRLPPDRQARVTTTAMGVLRQTVFERDRQCVAALLDRSHECRDGWGTPHGPADLRKMTLEHVKVNGVRVDHPHFTITLCASANVRDHWSSANLLLATAYLAGVKAGERRA